MGFWNILDTLLLGPLKLVFEWIFQLAYSLIGHPGLAIIALSLIMNILVLPLYKRADAMQERSRDMEQKLKKGVDHIKKTFSGDERMMILQAYYRENNYKPTDALNGSVSLLLEIPFFMAAYQFLSHLQIMNGVSLGPIADLSQPDRLLEIGGTAINVLPIAMTLINVISSAIYLKGFPLKTKIQLYGIALFFLVFLYQSPSCLVFYWTLNNVFSLVKNIFYKLKNPRRAGNILMCIAGLGLLVAGSVREYASVAAKVFLLIMGAVLQLPAIMELVKNKKPVAREKTEPVPNKKLFFFGTLFLSILVGAMIPSTFIAASPQEFVDVANFLNPMWYIVSALCFSAGIFMVWLRVFYWLATPRGKVLFERAVWILCAVMIVNYLCFGTKLGMLSPDLQYENGVAFTAGQQLLNLLVLAALGVLAWFAVRKCGKALPFVLLTACLVVATMSVINTVKIGTSVSGMNNSHVGEGEEQLSIPLSKEGKNVVVLMLDRGLGQHVPYIMNEKPELKEQFTGFTYYQNTISYGEVTNIAAPALFGGYEYTPVEMNKRDQETLEDKHNEALKVMPTLFSQEGYKVTVVDPPYANYQWIPDIRLYEGMQGVDAYLAEGVVHDQYMGVTVDTQSNKRNIFCLSLMKTLPLCLQPVVYDDGRYVQAEQKKTEVDSEIFYDKQYSDGMHKSYGMDKRFMSRYVIMDGLSDMTKITDGSTNTFLCMTNNVTHDPVLLQTPDYVPAMHVNNEQYDAQHSDRFTVDGRTMKVETINQLVHYQANMSALLRLGEWFDYLREQGVYDNTRIILVSDHGRDLGQFGDMKVGEGKSTVHLETYMPLLMVKDFGDSGEFVTSQDFMTNADVPTMALNGLIDDPVNPFTGNAITDDAKNGHAQIVLVSHKYDVTVNNGNAFLPGRWLSVSGNVLDCESWMLLDEETVLKEHELPE